VSRHPQGNSGLLAAVPERSRWGGKPLQPQQQMQQEQQQQQLGGGVTVDWHTRGAPAKPLSQGGELAGDGTLDLYRVGAGEGPGEGMGGGGRLGEGWEGALAGDAKGTGTSSGLEKGVDRGGASPFVQEAPHGEQGPPRAPASEALPRSPENPGRAGPRPSLRRSRAGPLPDAPVVLVDGTIQLIGDLSLGSASSSLAHPDGSAGARGVPQGIRKKAVTRGPSAGVGPRVCGAAWRWECGGNGAVFWHPAGGDRGAFLGASLFSHAGRRGQAGVSWGWWGQRGQRRSGGNGAWWARGRGTARARGGAPRIGVPSRAPWETLRSEASSRPGSPGSPHRGPRLGPPVPTSPTWVWMGARGRWGAGGAQRRDRRLLSARRSRELPGAGLLAPACPEGGGGGSEMDEERGSLRMSCSPQGLPGEGASRGAGCGLWKEPRARDGGVRREGRGRGRRRARGRGRRVGRGRGRGGEGAEEGRSDSPDHRQQAQQAGAIGAHPSSAASFMRSFSMPVERPAASMPPRASQPVRRHTALLQTLAQC